MSNANIPDLPNLIQICKNDHSLVMKVIDNYVKVVSTGNDKDLKHSILENLQNLTQNLMELPRGEKRPNGDSEIEPINKRLKIDSNTKTELPNEIWLKIINYMKTKDLFKNFILVCKQFNTLAMDPKAVKYLSFTNLKTENQVKYSISLLKRYMSLNGLTLQLENMGTT